MTIPSPPSIVLYAEDVFAGTKRTIGVAASRPRLLEPIRRADPAEDVWLIAVDPASAAFEGEIQLPRRCKRADACAAVALVSDGRGGIAAVAPAINVVRGDVPVQQACLARSSPTHTQIGEAVAPGPDLLDATVTLAVNDIVQQSGSLRDLVVSPWQLMQSIERLVHLAPGDIVLLGAPPGTANDRGDGWLTIGDRLEILLTLAPRAAILTAHVAEATHDTDAAAVGRPGRVIGTGTNYYSHVSEMGSTPPARPTANFFKLSGAVCGNGAEILIPLGSKVDYEGEIAVIVGELLIDVGVDEVADADLTLCLSNDVSAREAPTTHLTIAKSAPGFCPLGAAQVPIRDIQLADLEFVVEVNGEIRQHGRAADMVFGIAEIVSMFSHAVALRPGDIILTGSPAGVGAARQPQTFLDAGDIVRIRSPQLGVLENTFVTGNLPDLTL